MLDVVPVDDGEAGRLLKGRQVKDAIERERVDVGVVRCLEVGVVWRHRRQDDDKPWRRRLDAADKGRDVKEVHRSEDLIRKPGTREAGQISPVCPQATWRGGEEHQASVLCARKSSALDRRRGSAHSGTTLPAADRR
jgi:hypothetical protein